MTVERGSRPNVHFDMASHNTSLHFEMTLKVFNVVGITKGGQGRSCGLHSVCGESLKVGDLTLSVALISSPFFFSIIFISNYYGNTKLARNLLFFGMCLEIGIYSLLDNPSSFTLNLT